MKHSWMGQHPAQTLIYIVGLVAFTLMMLPIGVLFMRGIRLLDMSVMPQWELILSALWLSVRTTALSAFVITLLGTPLAYLLAFGNFPGKRLMSLLVELPIVLPPAVAGLALLLTYGRRGLLGEPLLMFGVSIPFTIAAVVIAQTFVAAPFYIRAAQLGFSSIPQEVQDAARVDGATEWAVFWRVLLPLSFRALAAGLVLSWARALGEFGATILFAGNIQGRTQTMPLLVYQVFNQNLDAAIWTGLLLVGLALLALLLSRVLLGEDDEM